ncbi:MAG: DUF45 domain-containing protein [Alphaproteobacteria bacterium]|nr:DUF45 domain-containing protein [Alphaproteobacteria bacterium]
MKELSYQTVRSPRRKTVTITVERDRTVIVRAPQDTTDEEVQRLVVGKRQWIIEKLRHPQKYRNRLHPPGKEVVNGEAALYLGCEYRIELVETSSGEVEFAQGFKVPRAHQAKRRRVLKDWYMARAKEIILPRAQQRGHELGARFKAAKIVENWYRWGSCTVRDNVNFNWRLIKAPMFVIDYVIVHELAHFLEANHTARFWSIMRAHVPAMDKAKDWLKEHGQVLEEEV